MQYDDDDDYRHGGQPTFNQKASYRENAENVMVLYDHYDAGMLYATSKSRMLQKIAHAGLPFMTIAVRQDTQMVR
ncbi:hypothetical protein Q7P36_010657 [Cladosporium allicinum]